MKYDMDDLAVLIPVRVESLVRLENLLSVVRYLQTHFSLDIKVWEADAFNNQFLERLLPPDVEYKFIQDEDPVFYRTRYINDMVVDTQKKFVAIWDADVVFPVIQVHYGQKRLLLSILMMAFFWIRAPLFVRCSSRVVMLICCGI